MTSSADCPGDSGSGLIEPGAHPTVIGITSGAACPGGETQFALVDSHAALRFINATR